MPAAGDVVLATDATATNSDSSIGLPASGFSDTGCFAFTALDGKLIEIRFFLTNTSAITATTGNITDTTAFTVDAAYRPAAERSLSWNNKTVGGTAVLNTDGTLVLCTASDSVGAGSSIRAQVCFMNS